MKRLHAMLDRLRRWLGLAHPLPLVTDAQWARVEATLPFLDYLEPGDRPRLRRMALEFLACKQFHGAHDFALHDDMLLSIALQASLPVLNIGLDAYKGWVGVVVYAGDFIIPRREYDEAGVVHEYDIEALGEAWEGGPVLLSWFEGEAQPFGVNVVIHEFAHKLDMENGSVDGLPRLKPGMARTHWADAFSSAYESFCDEVERGVHTEIDSYGAEHPGEFFAVVSEVFFETPHVLQRRFPQVYEQLVLFYGVNPVLRETLFRGGSA